MRIVSLVLAVLCALAAAKASAVDLRTTLLKLDFVPGRQDPQCIEPQYEAENKGEWGGKLEVVKPGGERQPILEGGNVQAMLRVGDDLYVFEGLSHLDMATGAVYVIRKFDVEPELERVTLLTDTPVYATLVHRPREWHWFWIVGRSSLTELNEDLGVLKVHPFGPRSRR